MFQKVIFIFLIVGLGFFLYLLKTGEINKDDFNIKKLQGPVRFEISENSTQDDFNNKLSEIRLIAQGVEYPVYTFGGTDFRHVNINERYQRAFNVPAEAKDAVTGVWLGERYIFYVLEVGEGGEKEYQIFRTVYTTDYAGDVEYKQIKVIRTYNASGKNDKLY